MTIEDPEQTLREVERLKAHSRRRAHGGAWVPAAVLAALVLLSTVLYRSAPPTAHWNSIGIVQFPYWAGLPAEQLSPPVSYLYWLVGLPAAFAVIAWWYRRRARQTGFRVAWRLFAAVGLGALLLLVVLLAVPTEPPADPYAAHIDVGLRWGSGFATPLIAVAASLVALAWVERAPMLAAAGGWLALLAWWQGATLYGQLPYWLYRLFDGGQPIGLGGQTDLPVPGMLALMCLPLLVWVVLAAVRSRPARG